MLVIYLCIFLPGPVYGQKNEVITDFASHVLINEDSNLAVTETITVVAKGRKIKRGIYRDFPTKYKDRTGNTVRIGFSLKQVLRDGEPEPYHKQNTANGIRIYIGDEDVFLSPGAIAKATVEAGLVIFLAPSFDDGLRFLQHAKNYYIQNSIMQFAVEALCE